MCQIYVLGSTISSLGSSVFFKDRAGHCVYVCVCVMKRGDGDGVMGRWNMIKRMVGIERSITRFLSVERVGEDA